MKSKYLDIKKFKEQFDPHQNDKISRKQTKPKKSFKSNIRNEIQTQSEFNAQSEEKQVKKLPIPNKKNSKQMLKAQKESPKRLNPTRFEQSSSNNQVLSNKTIQQKRRQKNLKDSRHITECPQQVNFIGELNNYLNELKKSKLAFNQNEEIQNQTLLLNKLNFLDCKKPSSNTLQKSSRWENKIKKQKSINRNLQKCIIQIQKVLWDRNDKLQMMEEEIRQQSRHKQNFIRKANEKEKFNLSKTIFFNKDYANKTISDPKRINKNIFFHDHQKQSLLNQISKISSRQRQLYDTYSDTQQQSEATFKQKRPRRKTQTPINIQKLLSKTLGNKRLEKASHQKAYYKFQKKELNDV